MKVAVVLCAVFVYASAQGYGSSGGSFGGSSNIQIGGGFNGVSGGSLGGSSGQVIGVSAGQFGGGQQISLGGGGGSSAISAAELANRVGQPSGQILSANYDLAQARVTSSQGPDVQVGSISSEFGGDTLQGEASESAGGSQAGRIEEQDGDVQIGEPVENLIAYEVERNHERVIPITRVVYKTVPVVRTIIQQIPIRVTTYRKQPIKVTTQHSVNEQLQLPQFTIDSVRSIIRQQGGAVGSVGRQQVSGSSLAAGIPRGLAPGAVSY
mgnify:FL=1